MKKTRPTENSDLRAEYRRSDFSRPLERGKYAKRLREASNVVVLSPEVAEAFPNESAVNSALLSLIKLARRTTTRPNKRKTGTSLDVR
jgi:hypothetical protein